MCIARSRKWSARECIRYRIQSKFHGEHLCPKKRLFSFKWLATTVKWCSNLNSESLKMEWFVLKHLKWKIFAWVFGTQCCSKAKWLCKCMHRSQFLLPIQFTLSVEESQSHPVFSNPGIHIQTSSQRWTSLLASCCSKQREITQKVLFSISECFLPERYPPFRSWKLGAKKNIGAQCTLKTCFAIFKVTHLDG